MFQKFLNLKPPNLFNNFKNERLESFLKVQPMLQVNKNQQDKQPHSNKSNQLLRTSKICKA